MSARRILVVDDEQDILDLLEDALSSEGFAVDTAPDARGALDLIRDHIYDVAVLDFHLPDMDGIMLHHHIRQMDEELAERTVFVSGMTQDPDRMDYYAAVGGAFLAKPFDVTQVLEAIAAVIKRDED